MIIDIDFPSYNQRDQVYGWIYVPSDCQPKGIIQVIHGFGEHSRRYMEIIMHFVQLGFVVAADDHVGHGLTAKMNTGWGDWGDKGFHTMMEDEHTLTTLAIEKYPDIPCFLYGHSMGSFIVRDYITKYPDLLQGAIISGTAGDFPHLKSVMTKLEKALAEGKGNESDPAYMSELMGWLNERIEDVQLGSEWISHNNFILQDMIDDPLGLRNQPMTNKSVYDFCQMIDFINGEKWAKEVPEWFPILSLSGSDDPIGNYGEGVFQVSNWLQKTKHFVITVVYPALRHEIFSYPEEKINIFHEMDFFIHYVSFLDEDFDEFEDGNDIQNQYA